MAIYSPKTKKDILNAPFTTSEVAEAVKSMKNSKAPGVDGLPIELYKILWAQISEIFVAAIHECFQREALYEEAKIGILNLIPKPGKDSRILKNLRPITLLNTDYKVIEKCIARRMDQVMDDIIHTDQKGFVRGRSIFTNIRKLLDLIRYCENEEIPALFLSLDFKKCFDQISFKIIQGSLRFFEFPDYICKWVEILYTDFSVKVSNNGHMSHPIKIERSVHQGGCCSSYLFLCCAEILALILRSNKSIKGIPVEDILFILNQFADDTDVCSLFDQCSLSAILQDLENFKLQSGFEISYDKTAILRVGSMKDSDAMLYTQKPTAWKNDVINVLGIDIASDPEIVMKNYDKCCEKMKKVFCSWKNRGLSLLGKISVINTLVASLFIYKFMTIPNLPQSGLNAIEEEMNKFIWNGKRAKIPLRVLKRSKKDGGLGLVDLKKRQDAVKITWIQLLQSDEKLEKLVYSLIAPRMKNDIWKCNIKEADVKGVFKVDDFWLQVLKAWAKINYREEVLPCHLAKLHD